MRLRRPRRPPWRKLFTLLQWVLFLLVGIYMDLFFEIHKLSITSDHHSRENRIVAVPNFPKLKQQQKKKNATTTTILPSSTRINTHYNEYGYNYTNRIVEGKLAVEYYLQSHKPLWEHSQTLPQWMKQYFEWHQHTHKWLLEHPDEWNTTNLNYYVVECSEFWNKCGGTADRLSPLPLHIKLASDTQRLLLIYWTKPAPLEEFLLPPIGGVDWRMPEWLVKHFWVDENYYPAPFEKRMIRNSRRKNLRWVRVKYQSHNHGSEYYNSQRSKQEPTFDAVVHDLWRVFFTPHSNIAQQIETQMHLSQLSPGRYVAAHLRALYQVQERDPAIVQWWATNAVNCVTSKLSSYNSGGPILFVSDTTLATETAAEYGRQHSLKVVHRSHKTLPLHLEKANVTTDDLTLYYDTFVDLYMMGMSQCVAYHMGGYGILGVRISYNSSCFHHMLAQMEPCNLEIQTTTTITSNNNNNNMEWESPLFLPPMRMLADPNNNSYLATANNNHNHMIQTNTTTKTKTTTIDENTTIATTTTTTMQKSQRKRGQKADDPDITKSEKGIVSTTTTTTTKTRYRSKSYNYTEITLQDPMLYQTFQASSSPEGETTTNLWRHSKTIPSWMKKYFRWHQSQRQKYVNPEHWNASPSNIKYLIMECLEHQPKCGGTSDRLKPLPTLVRIAAYTNRLLLIHWNRPAMLEEFLLPPKGGVDWRVPEWMRKFVLFRLFVGSNA